MSMQGHRVHSAVRGKLDLFRPSRNRVKGLSRSDKQAHMDRTRETHVKNTKMLLVDNE